MRWCAVLLVIPALFLPIATGLTAEQPARIGATVESLRFKDIRALPRSLDDLGEAQAFVFVFTNTTCPLVQKYLPRLKSLHESYHSQQVQFVAVNVGSGETIRAMASYALRNALPFPIVKNNDEELNLEVSPRTGWVLSSE